MPFWLKLTMAAALVFLLSAAGAWWVNDRSSLPNWLAGTSTAAALLAAIVAARHAGRAFALETDREQRWIGQQIRSQASLIAAWPGHASHGWTKVDDLDVQSTTIEAVTVNLRNASDIPVTNLSIEATVIIEDAAGDPVATHPLGAMSLRVLAPTDDLTAVLVKAATPLDLAHYGHTAEGPAPYWVDIELTFRDAGGRDWLRTADGKLVLMQDAEAYQ